MPISYGGDGGDGGDRGYGDGSYGGVRATLDGGVTVSVSVAEAVGIASANNAQRIGGIEPVLTAEVMPCHAIPYHSIVIPSLPSPPTLPSLSLSCFSFALCLVIVAGVFVHCR